MPWASTWLLTMGDYNVDIRALVRRTGTAAVAAALLTSLAAGPVIAQGTEPALPPPETTLPPVEPPVVPPVVPPVEPPPVTEPAPAPAPEPAPVPDPAPAPAPQPAPQPAPLAPLIDPATGYTIDPGTGFLIHPGTGWLIESGSGYLIDGGSMLYTDFRWDPATGLVTTLTADEEPSSPSPSPAPEATATPSATPSATPTASASASATPTATPSPSRTPVAAEQAAANEGFSTPDWVIRGGVIVLLLGLGALYYRKLRRPPADITTKL